MRVDSDDAKKMCRKIYLPRYDSPDHSRIITVDRHIDGLVVKFKVEFPVAISHHQQIFVMLIVVIVIANKYPLRHLLLRPFARAGIHTTTCFPY